MNGKLRKVIAALAVLVMVFTLSSCGKGVAEDETFVGELVDAQNNRLVVRNVEQTMLFVTTTGTVYELQGEKEICVGDELEITYHKADGTFLADTVRLTVHEEETLVFGGEVTELDKNYITVRSESLTAGFSYNDETTVEGNLNVGDAVTITYEGNLSERPHAKSIVVIQEKAEETLKSIHGTVSEVADKSVLVSMDSADAARFQVTEDTIINGDATSLKVGDEVNLVYTGKIGEDPVARSITISRDDNQTYYVMDGVIDKVHKKSLVVKTAKKSYTFTIVKETRIQNMKYMAPGHRVTITYVGKLNKDPVAASIYCSKSTVKKEKETTKATTKATQETTTTEPTETTEATKATQETQATDPTNPTDPTEPTNPTDPTEPTEPTDPTEATDPTEPTTPPEPEPEEVLINVKGTITEWGNPCAIKVDGGGTLTLDISDAAISGGYVPEEGDEVMATYDKTDMKLMSIQLVYRYADNTDNSGGNNGGDNNSDNSGDNGGDNNGDNSGDNGGDNNSDNSGDNGGDNGGDNNGDNSGDDNGGDGDGE